MNIPEETTQDKPDAPFSNMPFAAMMKQMMGGQQADSCNCADMVTQMMAMCGGAQASGDKTERAQEAAKESADCGCGEAASVAAVAQSKASDGCADDCGCKA